MDPVIPGKCLLEQLTNQRVTRRERWIFVKALLLGAGLSWAVVLADLLYNNWR